MAEPVVVAGKKYTPEEVEKALLTLQKQKERQLAYRAKSQATPEAKAKQKENNLRRRITNQLILLKAKQSGIVVTKEEVERALRAKKTSAPKAVPKK